MVESSMLSDRGLDSFLLLQVGFLELGESSQDLACHEDLQKAASERQQAEQKHEAGSAWRFNM